MAILGVLFMTELIMGTLAIMEEYRKCCMC